jgi:hypothetical protein
MHLFDFLDDPQVLKLDDFPKICVQLIVTSLADQTP